MMENHEAAIGQLSKQVVVMKTDIHELQEINKTVEAQLGKIVQSQTLILTQFAGKSEPTMLQI
jgi:TolA-binding protein